MSDLERELNTLLNQKFSEVRVPHVAPERVLRRTRRRQLRTVAVSGAAAILIVAGSILGLRTLLVERENIPAVPTRTETVDGVGITFPTGWSLAPCQDMTPEQGCFASNNEAPVFVLSNDRVTSSDLGCPNRDGNYQDGAILLLQNQRLATEGPWAVSWPVEPESIDVTDECFTGWTFFRAGWTVAGRTFEARFIFAASVSDGNRAALLDAFRGLTFGPSTRSEQPAIATGLIAGRPWRLVESQSDAPVTVTLDVMGRPSSGYGFGDPGREFAWQVVGRGGGAVALIFGPVDQQVNHVRLEGRGREARLIPLARALEFNLFILQIHADVGAELVVIVEDGQGHVAREPLTLRARAGKIISR